MLLMMSTDTSMPACHIPSVTGGITTMTDGLLLRCDRATVRNMKVNAELGLQHVPYCSISSVTGLMSVV